jgi:hypothetical protein
MEAANQRVHRDMGAGQPIGSSGQIGALRGYDQSLATVSRRVLALLILQRSQLAIAEIRLPDGGASARPHSCRIYRFGREARAGQIAPRGTSIGQDWSFLRPFIPLDPSQRLAHPVKSFDPEKQPISSR